MIQKPTDPPRDEDDEAFLRRWSRRKTAATQPPAIEEPAVPEAIPEPLPPGDEDMVPVESLTEDSDYAPFLSPRVSADLQRAALRKLFGAPAFNVRDGLDDYDEDFTSFQSLGKVITADLRHRLELEARRQAEALTAPPAGDAMAEPDSPSRDTPPTIATTDATSAATDAGPAARTQDEEDAV